MIIISNNNYSLRNVNLSIPIPGVMIQIVQASLGATSLSYNSTMTANLSALIQEGVSNIGCGSESYCSGLSIIKLCMLQVACNKCTNYRAYLAYQKKEDRVCVDCFVHLKQNLNPRVLSWKVNLQ